MAAECYQLRFAERDDSEVGWGLNTEAGVLAYKSTWASWSESKLTSTNEGLLEEYLKVELM